MSVRATHGYSTPELSPKKIDRLCVATAKGCCEQCAQKVSGSTGFGGTVAKSKWLYTWRPTFFPRAEGIEGCGLRVEGFRLKGLSLLVGPELSVKASVMSSLTYPSSPPRNSPPSSHELGLVSRKGAVRFVFSLCANKVGSKPRIAKSVGLPGVHRAPHAVVHLRADVHDDLCFRG